MTDRNINRKIEGILYRHFKKKSSIRSLYNSLTLIENRIRNIKEDIKECNVEIQDYLQGIRYDNLNVQENSNPAESAIERSLIRSIEKLEYELAQELRKRNKKKMRIRDLERKTKEIDSLLCKLDEEEIKICELTYADNWSERRIAYTMNIGKSTINRKKEKIIKYLDIQLKKN